VAQRSITGRMRRILAILLLAATAVVLAGCAGVDGQKAQSLLLQADAAQKALTSEQFSMRENVTAEGMSVDMQMAGGGYLKGAQAGDVYLVMTGQSPDGKSLDATLVKHGDVITVSADGQTQTLSASQAEQQYGGELHSALSGFDFAQYVKSVKVSDTTLPNGDPADQIVGVIDTQGAANSLTKGLGLGGLAKFGDTRAVLTISRKTHLVTAALIDMDMQVLGKKMTISLTYGLTGVNVPIDFPATG
jgi:hypothetical protein